jgi:hypothetical protein
MSHRFNDDEQDELEREEEVEEETEVEEENEGYLEDEETLEELDVDDRGHVRPRRRSRFDEFAEEEQEY